MAENPGPAGRVHFIAESPEAVHLFFKKLSTLLGNGHVEHKMKGSTGSFDRHAGRVIAGAVLEQMDDDPGHLLRSQRSIGIFPHGHTEHGGIVFEQELPGGPKEIPVGHIGIEGPLNMPDTESMPGNRQRP
jgi:hypothetical protein